MANWIGQDPAEVQDLAALFTQKATDLEGIVSALNSKLGSTTWQGTDRNNFESMTWSQLQTALNQAATTLRDTGTIASQNATDQINTSAS
jgi:uncharacterized protein YukE